MNPNFEDFFSYKDQKINYPDILVPFYLTITFLQFAGMLLQTSCPQTCKLLLISYKSFQIKRLFVSSEDFDFTCLVLDVGVHMFNKLSHYF